MKHKKNELKKNAYNVQCWSISINIFAKYLKILYSQIKI